MGRTATDNIRRKKYGTGPGAGPATPGGAMPKIGRYTEEEIGITDRLDTTYRDLIKDILTTQGKDLQKVSPLTTSTQIAPAD